MAMGYFPMTFPSSNNVRYQCFKLTSIDMSARAGAVDEKPIASRAANKHGRTDMDFRKKQPAPILTHSKGASVEATLN